MSRHHIAQRFAAFTKQRRAELAPQLPLPCISCGRPVHPDPPTPPGMLRRPTTWHVGHIVDAADHGRPTRENTGAVHARCNLRDGGRRGAEVTNGARRAGNGIRPW